MTTLLCIILGGIIGFVLGSVICFYLLEPIFWGVVWILHKE